MAPMGQRQVGSLGLTLHLDDNIFGPGLRRDGLPMRLVVPGPLGTPDWHVATAVNRTHEAKRHSAHTARTPLEKFKEKLIQLQVDDRKPRTAIEGLADGQMAYLDDFRSFRLRTDVAVRFDEMSEEMLKAYAGRPNQAPRDSIGVASTYRSADEDARAWEKSFKKHFARTAKARQETGDELGNKALNIMFNAINGKKAPAGFSGHTHGIAADMTTTEFGTVWTVNSDYDHQIGWQRTWLYDWLVKNAAEYDFYQLKNETWHWEYHEKEPGKHDQCWGGSVILKQRRVPKPA